MQCNGLSMDRKNKVLKMLFSLLQHKHGGHEHLQYTIHPHTHALLPALMDIYSPPPDNLHLGSKISKSHDIVIFVPVGGRSFEFDEEGWQVRGNGEYQMKDALSEIWSFVLNRNPWPSDASSLVLVGRPTQLIFISDQSNLPPSIWGPSRQLDDQHRNTNMNKKDHLVGQLTRVPPFSS